MWAKRHSILPAWGHYCFISGLPFVSPMEQYVCLNISLNFKSLGRVVINSQMFANAREAGNARGNIIPQYARDTKWKFLF